VRGVDRASRNCPGWPALTKQTNLAKTYRKLRYSIAKRAACYVKFSHARQLHRSAKKPILYLIKDRAIFSYDGALDTLKIQEWLDSDSKSVVADNLIQWVVSGEKIVFDKKAQMRKQKKE